MAMADEFGIQVGEEFMTFRTLRPKAARRTVQIPVRVAGIWKVIDAEE